MGSASGVLTNNDAYATEEQALAQGFSQSQIDEYRHKKRIQAETCL